MKIFLSYSQIDAKLAGFAAQFIRSLDQGVLRDVDCILPGSRWRRRIAEMLEECDKVVIVWTAAAKASEWVEREYTTAIRMGKPVIPMLFDATVLPAVLQEFQSVDFRHDRSIIPAAAVCDRPVSRTGIRDLDLIRRSRRDLARIKLSRILRSGSLTVLSTASADIQPGRSNKEGLPKSPRLVAA